MAGSESGPAVARAPARVHAFLERRHGTARLPLHQPVLHKGIGKTVKKAQYVRIVSIAGLFQQLTNAFALVKTVKGKLGAGHSCGQIVPAELRVFRGLLAPLVYLFLPLLPLTGLVLAQTLGKEIGLRLLCPLRICRGLCGCGGRCRR